MKSGQKTIQWIVLPMERHGVFRKICQVKYAFIKLHRSLFRVRPMYRLLKVHQRSFYAWLKEPLGNKAKDDLQLTGLLKQAWLKSGCVYGYRKLHDDLRSAGETCSPNKVARLASLAGIKAQIGYKRKAGFYGGLSIRRSRSLTSQSYPISI